MSRIDELPLDLFGDDESSSTKQPAAGGPASVPPLQPGWDAAAIAAATSEHPGRMRAAIEIATLVIVLGLVMRVFGMSFALPFANGALVAVLYFRGGRRRVAWIDTLVQRGVERLTAELAVHDDEPVPSNVAEYRLVFDAAIVIVLAIATHIVTWMSGVDRLVPDGISWTVSLGAAIALYLLPVVRSNRVRLHTALYSRISRLLHPGPDTPAR